MGACLSHPGIPPWVYYARGVPPWVYYARGVPPCVLYLTLGYTSVCAIPHPRVYPSVWITLPVVYPRVWITLPVVYLRLWEN